MENKDVVKEELTTLQPSEGNTEEATTENEDVVEPAEPGSKTESGLLLQSLQKERDQRKEEQAKIKALEEEKRELEEKLSSSTLLDEDISEEGKELKKEISTLTNKIASIEEEKDFERLCVQYPALKDKEEEFKEFKSSEHPTAKMDSVAKIYLAENGFFEPKRPGLENPTGGTKTVVKNGMSSEEVASLRKNDFKKYAKLLQEGKIKISD